MTTPRPLVVVAIGGNALLHRGQPPDIDVQRANVREAAAALAALDGDRRLVITHGNGPQVGLLARQSEALAEGAPVPFDVLAAESEGLIGYLLAEQLSRHLGPDRVAVLLTRVVVDAADPGFSHPTKPIGSMLTEAEAAELGRQHGWAMAPDADGWRRVVASPQPIQVVEVAAIEALSGSGQVVVCAGGGGIPVAVGDDGQLVGMEAVIDKDLTSALLAAELGADELIVLTDVDGVHEHWGWPGSMPIPAATPDQLRGGSWASGSMGPKVEAACRFAEQTGRTARIGSLDHAAEVVAGRSGTAVRAAGLAGA